MRSLNGKNIAVTLLLGIALFAVTPLLLPTRDELGTMHIRDNETEKAFEFFSNEYHAGKRSASVMVPLSHLHLQRGDVDEAIRLIENLSDSQPHNIDLLRTLVDYYRSAQRYDDYMHLLEKLREIDPQ